MRSRLDPPPTLNDAPAPAPKRPARRSLRRWLAPALGISAVIHLVALLVLLLLPRTPQTGRAASPQEVAIELSQEQSSAPPQGAGPGEPLPTPVPTAEPTPPQPVQEPAQPPAPPPPRLLAETTPQAQPVQTPAAQTPQAQSPPPPDRPAPTEAPSPPVATLEAAPTPPLPTPPNPPEPKPQPSPQTLQQTPSPPQRQAARQEPRAEPRPAARANPRPAPSTANPFAPYFIPQPRAPQPQRYAGGAINTSIGPVENYKAEPPRRASSDATSDIQVIGAPVGSDWQEALHEWWVIHRRYPQMAIDNNEQGTLNLRFTVDRAGHVSGAEVVSRSGSQWLDMGAVATFRNAHLPPLPTNMEGNSATMTITISYILTH